MKLVSKAKGAISTKVARLKGIKLAGAVRSEYSTLLADISRLEHDLLAQQSKRQIDVNQVKNIIGQLAAKLQSKPGLDKIGRPHFN